MSKEIDKNLELATEIVDKLCVPTKETIHVGAMPVNEGDHEPETKQVYTSRILVAGMTQAFTADTKKAAREQAIDYIKTELDEGNLVLSDTWAEDNLQ